MGLQNNKQAQIKAVEKEYREALTDRNFPLARRIAEANKDLELFYLDLA
jgi:hypothetical protein